MSPATLPEQVRRIWRISLLVGAVSLVLLGLPAVSLAGTFSWVQPRDFTASGAGANPETAYGQPSWSYSSSSAALGFSSSVAGGLAGWTDNETSPSTFVAVTTSGTRELEMLPAAGGSVTLGWASPFSQDTPVTVSGSVTQPNPGTLCGFTWSLTDGSTSVPLANGADNGTIPSQVVTLGTGGSLALNVTDASSSPLAYSSACDTAVVTLSITLAGGPPVVTLASPAGGGLISGGQPIFAGSAATAFGDQNHVTVRVYAGSAATGSPLQTLSALVSSGGYSVGPSSPLPDGRYTAQAEQDDAARPVDVGLSSANTFTVGNASPSVRLSSLGGSPLHTSTPTLSGTAGTGPSDSGTVKLLVYPGPDTSSAPIRLLTGAVGGGGAFSIQVAPGLDDGQYTAVATQDGQGGSVGLSGPVTFRIKVHAPATTLVLPRAGGNTDASQPIIGGVAGNVLGDSQLITVTLWSGGAASGRPYGTTSFGRDRGIWFGRWPKPLRLGLYTVRASQRDDAGHTATTAAHTFLIVPPPSVVGAGVSVAQNGLILVPITCVAPAGEVCTGNVLIVTIRSFRPVFGGPAGRLLLLFASVSVPAGQTQVIRGRVGPDALRALRRGGNTRVAVTANLAWGGHPAQRFTATRLVRIGPAAARQAARPASRR
ncbi:MAG: Ig-like domain-containing protein [Solirubrobacteraceae bacterium]